MSVELVIEIFHDIHAWIYAIPNVHMWFSLFLIVAAIISYANDKIALEITSITVIAVLLFFFHIFPLVDDDGTPIMTMQKLLLGFSNPALVSVLCLLVLGQALIQTGALNEVVNLILRITHNNAVLAISVSLIFVTIISAFLNNTPVVVIFIPILAALAKSVNISVSKVMIPLSFVSILGGMTTLIGSSTNLLVSGIMVEMGREPLGFFDFTFPGVIIASVGMIYVLFVLPKLLPDRASMVKSMALNGDDNRQFVTQIEIGYDANMVGMDIKNGTIDGMPNLSIMMLQRGEHAFLPPFDEDIVIRPRDIVILSSQKKDLAEFFKRFPEVMGEEAEAIKGESEEDINDTANMAEIVISPSSKVIGKTLEETGFHGQFNCLVLGIQRQARTIRSKITETKLASGDVLLVLGKKNDILHLHESKDFLLMEWSTEEIHSEKNAGKAISIFGMVVVLSASGILPITVAAFAGVALIVLTKCLNMKQVAKSLDGKIILLVASSLALGAALQDTGGAEFIASNVVSLMDGFSALSIMVMMFIIMILMTNVLSNNATAVLFTPIAINLADQLNVDPRMFLFVVIFGCNCSFASPIGYQTNLLVMGPGHHKFSDFIRGGVPLTLIVLVTYTIYAAFYFT